MKSWFRLFSFAILASLGNAAMAADDAQLSADNLHWRCWYDQQIHITCLIDTVSKASGLPTQDFPANLPPIVKLMRTDPGALRSKIIHIPLHTQPYDMEFTAVLARSTVCGSTRACTVNFSMKLPPAEEIVALLNKHLPGEGDSTTTLAMLGGVSDDFE